MKKLCAYDLSIHGPMSQTMIQERLAFSGSGNKDKKKSEKQKESGTNCSKIEMIEQCINCFNKLGNI